MPYCAASCTFVTNALGSLRKNNPPIFVTMSCLKTWSMFLIVLLSFGSEADAQIVPVPQSGHSVMVNHAAIDPNGSSMLTWDWDESLIHWDLKSGLHLPPFTGLNSRIKWLVFLDQKHFLLQSFDRVIFAGHLDTSYVVPIDTLPDRYDMGLLIRSNGYRPYVMMAKTQGNRLISFYDVWERQAIPFSTLNGLESVKDMVLSEDQERVYLADDNKAIWMFEKKKSQISRIYQNDSANIRSLAVCGSFLIAEQEVGGKSTLMAHEFRQGKTALSGRSVPFPLPMEVRKRVALNPSGQSVMALAINFEDRTGTWLTDWDPHKGTCVKIMPVDIHSRLIPAGKGQTIGILNAQKNIHALYNAREKVITHWLGQEVQTIQEMVYNEQTNMLHLYSNSSMTLQHLNLSGLEMESNDAGMGSSKFVFVMKDGGMVQASSDMKKIYMYRPDGTRDSMPNTVDWVAPVFSRSNGHLAARGKGTKNTWVLDTRNKTVITRELPGVASWSENLLYSDDGSYLYIETGRRTFEVFAATDYQKKMRVDLSRMVEEGETIMNKYFISDSGNYFLFIATASSGYGTPQESYVYILKKSRGTYKKHARLVFQHEVKGFYKGEDNRNVLVLFEPIYQKPSIHSIHIEEAKVAWTSVLDTRQVTNVTFLPNGLLLVRGNSGQLFPEYDGRVSFHDPKSGELRFSLLTSPNSFVFASKDGTMMCSKGGSSLLAYQVKTGSGRHLLKGSTLEAQFNQPHVILKEFQCTDTSRIQLYEKAYHKRMKRIGTGWQFNPDSIPEIELLNLIEFSWRNWVSEKAQLQLVLNYTCKTSGPSNIDLTVNGVPQYSTSVIELKSQNQTGRYYITMELQPGSNKIEISLKDSQGYESVPIYFEIWSKDTIRPPKTYLVGIGVSQYADSTMNLVYAAKDTRDLASFLSNMPNVILDTFTNERATRENLLKVRERLSALKPHDRVIMAFSGHGVLDSALNFYIALHQMNFNLPSSGGMLFEDFLALLDSTPARQKLLLLDACHSGELDREEQESIATGSPGLVVAGTRGGKAQDFGGHPSQRQDPFEFMKQNFEEVTSSNGTTIIAAAGGKEYALENAYYSNGVFTWCLLKGWREGLADSDGDKEISVDELKNYLIREVPRLTNHRQKPTVRRENPVHRWMLPR